MSVKARKKIWEHDRGRLALLVIALAALGMALPTAVIWAGLMLWHRDFKKRFDAWYMRWVLAGLAADVLFGATVANTLDIPPSWVALVLVAGGVIVGLRGRL